MTWKAIQRGCVIGAMLAAAAIAPRTVAGQQSAREAGTAPPVFGVGPQGAVLISAPAGSSKLRAISAEKYFPPVTEPFRIFTSVELPLGSALMSEVQGRVVSYWPATGELVSYEVVKERHSVLLPPGQLPRGLQDLELSAHGLAVAAQFGETTTLFVIGMPSGGERVTFTRLSLPIRAVDTAFSARGGLLVLSDDQHALLEIPLGDLLAAPPVTDPKVNVVLRDLPGPALAVAEWRDVVYISTGTELRVVSRQAAGSVTRLPLQMERADALRATENHLVAFDKSRGRIVVAHRPVPVTARLHGDARDTAGRLLFVMELLHRSRMLPTRRVEANRGTAFELMVAHQVLPELPLESASEDLRRRTEALLCALNPTACSPLRLSPETRLLVPDLPLHERRVTTRVTFGERTLEQVLQERLLAKHRPSDADLLTALLNVNRFLDQTLDAKLYRLSFNPWQLATDPSLQPGVALTLKDGTFATSGSQAKCAVALTTQPLAKEKTGLDTILPTHRAEHVRTMLSVPGQVDVALGELEVVAGVPAGMTGCVDPGSGATHMVTEVIRAKTVFLRVRDASAAVQYPEEERLSAAASYPIKIAATTRPEWSAVIQEPVVLGFKAQPITGGSTASSEITASVPLSDLLRRRFEYLAVPVTGWEPVIAVPALELGVGSNLRTIQSRIDPTVTISPLQRSAAQTTASSAAVSIQPPPRRVTEEARGAEGQRIRTLINYPKNPPDTTGVVIAVAEVSKSVDRDHPGFRREDGSNVWSKEREDGSGITVEPSSAQPAPGDQEERDFKQADDHGTHVAGLLAGVGVPPGLAQQAQLFLLPAEEEAHKIRSRLEFAAKIPASVLNYSQIMWTSPEAIEQVGGGIDLLANNLLVVAATASNRGGQLLNQPSMLPIGYADGPNVIGVSAADERRQLLSGVSDYGKRYVQLLAYGKDVLGLAKKGAYARASGASQAAPQVAGAAALLVAQGKTNPAQIKARLIAAADWLPDYEEKVWGGFLNVGRASGNLLSNVLTRRNLQGMKVVASVSFAPGEKLQLRRSIDYRPDAVTPTQATSDGAIEWGRILRLVRQTWLPQNNRDRDSYRMVYLSEDGEVRIRKNVELQPNQEFVPQRCAPLLDADPTVAPAEPPPSAGHCDPVRVENIDDYISKFPEQTNITFRRSPQQ